MGLFDFLKRDKKGRMEKKPSKSRVEYHETLYSKDAPPQIPPKSLPRREWEHISSIEEKIDKLNRRSISEKDITEIEKKVDGILSRENR
ncbi:MAG: hypothetical protein DRN19_02655 [Thermoplasmata archaeon]|nr:MAG: hypothetical protein DRN19_02655 [Thermoplasmata archaeon]